MRRLVGERDQQLAAKEASFSVSRMRRRLTSAHEPKFSVEEQYAIPEFLRRKGEQGKRRRDH